jgi:hypothetical protein
MEKPDETGRATHDAADICAFGHVTAQASQCQIGLGRGATLLAADDVVDVKGKVRILLMD